MNVFGILAELTGDIPLPLVAVFILFAINFYRLRRGAFVSTGKTNNDPMQLQAALRQSSFGMAYRRNLLRILKWVRNRLRPVIPNSVHTGKPVRSLYWQLTP